MNAEYPVYIYVIDECSFRQFSDEKQLIELEFTDVSDGLYECWDSKANRFFVGWNHDRNCAQLQFMKTRDIENLQNHVSTYIIACRINNVTFGINYKDDSYLCDPKVMCEVFGITKHSITFPE